MMKRLPLEAFKAKQPTDTATIDQLLNQVLGNCHDAPVSSGGGEKDARAQESDDQR